MFAMCLPWLQQTLCLKNTGELKLQICKLMCNTITGFDVENNGFTLASFVHLNSTSFSIKKNFITERPRTRLGLNCFRYLGPKFWSSIHEVFKNFKKRLF